MGVIFSHFEALHVVGMGSVTVAFSDDVQFNAKQSGLKFVNF